MPHFPFTNIVAPLAEIFKMVDVGVHVPSNEKKSVGMLHVRIPCMFVHKMHHFTIYSISFFFIELFTLLVQKMVDMWKWKTEMIIPLMSLWTNITIMDKLLHGHSHSSGTWSHPTIVVRLKTQEPRHVLIQWQ